jgi:mannose-6-phosphate isomerase-like protein (cupin superfamily)
MRRAGLFVKHLSGGVRFFLTLSRDLCDDGAFQDIDQHETGVAMRGADAPRRVVDVADRHFPVIHGHIRQVVLEHWRSSRWCSGPGLRLRLGVTAGREQFGKQRERGNGIATSHHHGQDYIPPPVNQEGRSDGSVTPRRACGLFETALCSGRIVCIGRPRRPKGSFYMTEQPIDRRGSGPPKHYHEAQDEWFYCLAGEYLFEVGDERFRLAAGESALAPRRVPHAFLVRVACWLASRWRDVWNSFFATWRSEADTLAPVHRRRGKRLGGITAS